MNQYLPRFHNSTKCTVLSTSPGDLNLCVTIQQEVESFLHRSGRTGRAGRQGTAIAMYMSKEYNYFRKVLHETKVDNCEIIAPPAPRAVMEAAAKAVCPKPPPNAVLSPFEMNNLVSACIY